MEAATRETRYAEAVGDVLDEWPEHNTTAEHEAATRDVVRAVMAVADEEQAELRAEVERLWGDVKALAEDVADAGRRDRAVRGLIDEAELRRPLAHAQDGTPFPALIAATDLRAVLDKHAGA